MKRRRYENEKMVKIGAIILIVALCLAFAACGGPFTGFDDNEAIINTNTASVSGSEGITPVCKLNGTIDGVRKIKEIDLSANPTFEMDLTITSGRFKIVLIKDNVVTTVTSSNVTDSVTVDGLAAGKYVLKLVGEKATVELT